MVDPQHPSEGDRIGPYRIERTLGSGGMGEVVLAYDERLDRRVAIKRIRHQAAVTADDRERFRREARAVAALSHPAIVQVHDILTDGEDDAIVMELVEGCSLAQKLKSGPLPLGEAARLGRQVAEGLAEAHRAHLVHRDLKAENVMVTPADGSHPGRAKILDFGLAKRLRLEADAETLTRKGALVGTVRAMSPEQAEGREVDPRSDLFSLGVLLYEMVTGRSPFRGSTPVITLRRVLTETPRPVRELRADAPVELAELIENLLDKEPGRRPRDAAAVARSLAGLEARGSSEAATPPPPVTHDDFGDEPTGSLATAPNGAPRPASEGSALALAGRRRQRLATVAGLLLIAILAGVLWRDFGRRSEPLRVVVPRPVIETPEPSEELELVASGVRVAALAILADLEGVAPVDPSEMAGTSGSTIAVARAVAADETLVASVERRGADAWIFLRRVRTDDGEIPWAGEFDVPLRGDRARLLAETMTVKLRRAYPRSPLRPGVPRLDAGDDDFAEFVRVSRRIDSGEAPLPPELQRLSAMIERSPRFLAARLRAAAVALTLYSDTRDTDYVERAAEWTRQARALAPEDPAAIQLEIQMALVRGDLEAAEAALTELTAVAPGSVEVLFGRFRVARKAGDLAAAEAAMEEVVERQPSWGNLYSLADLEVRRGDVDGARGHLDELLRRAPENTWGLGKLTQLELLYGDLERAVELAERAIAIRPHRSYFNNLGLARFYLGRYQDARTSYLQALAIDPDHLTVRLNLADAELALGHEEEALAGYRRIADELADRELAATESMTLAQCLARLGETRRAVAVTLETLQKHPDHAEVAYQAALVYSLVGETASAWVNVERALARGFQPRQFRIPAFDVLRSDPQFPTVIGTG